MPKTSLTDLRRDLFCCYLLTGMSIVDAHEAVGFKRNADVASNYHRTPAVQKCLSALKARFETVVFREAASNVTDEDLREFLYGNAVAARETQDWAPSNRAIELLGRDRGLFGAQAEQLQLVEEQASPVEEMKAAIRWLEDTAMQLQATTVEAVVEGVRQRILSIAGSPKQVAQAEPARTLADGVLVEPEQDVETLEQDIKAPPGVDR